MKESYSIRLGINHEVSVPDLPNTTACSKIDFGVVLSGNDAREVLNLAISLACGLYDIGADSIWQVTGIDIMTTDEREQQ